MKYFETVCITPHLCHVHFFVHCYQYGPNWMFGLIMELMACADLVAVQRVKAVFLLIFFDCINDMKYF